MIEQSLILTDMLVDDVRQLCALPGSPDQDEELAVVAQRVAALMRQRGLQTDTIMTSGAPVVIGRRAGRSPFTLLLYHHYDVAPSGPWRSWHHEPFQLAERDNALYGRGVADSKGPLAAHLAALAALLQSSGDLPCGVVMVAEGEGLAGSPSLPAAVQDLRQGLRMDACIASGGERTPDGRPICYGGAKGLLQIRLTSVGANQALPPGLAASVPNPLWRLLWALGQIKSSQEEVLINGFYDDVEGPSRSENQRIKSIRLDEAARLSTWGLSEFLFAASGTALVRTEATLPTCNISSLVVEPPGDLALIPVSATARLDFELVPRQLPQTIADQLRDHLEAKELPDVAVERLGGGYPPAHTALDHQFIQQICEAGRLIYGTPLERLPLGPFARPLFCFADAFNIPVATLGSLRPDGAIYGPNEHVPIEDLLRHGQLLIELLNLCAQG